MNHVVSVTGFGSLHQAHSTMFLGSSSSSLMPAVIDAYEKISLAYTREFLPLPEKDSIV